MVPKRRKGTTNILRNSPEELSSHLLRGGSLKSRIFADVFVILISSYKRIPWRIGLLEMLMVPQVTIKFFYFVWKPEVYCHFAVLCYVSVSRYLKKATTV